MTQAEKERLAKVGKTFNAKAYIKNEIEAIRKQVGDKKVLLAMSGGVDSSVCAVLLQKAIGKQLVCVFVDHGCMRLNEAKEVKDTLKGRGIKVNGKVVTQFDFALKQGMKIAVSKSKRNDTFKSKYVKIVYEDQYLVVIEKNEGILSHH